MTIRYLCRKVQPSRLLRRWMPALLALLALAAANPVKAAFTIDYPSTTPSSAFALNGDAAFLGDLSIQLTSVAQSNDPNQSNYDATVVQAGSVFYNAPVNVSKFNTTFRFRLTPWAGRAPGDPWADGLTFAIQNNDPTALGGGGSGLGYSGLPSSVALKFKTFALGDPANGGDPSSSTVSMLVNGQDAVGSGIGLTDLTASGQDFDLGSGATFRADVAYANSSLALTLTNEDTGRSTTLKFAVNIPAFVQSNTAYVGFTGATGLFVSDQRILSWQYTESGSITTPIRPTLTGLSLSSAAVGSPAFQLTITGAGFTPNAFARFDNTPLSNVSVTPTSMIVNVPAGLLTAKRTWNVTVFANGATSNALPFRVTSTNASGAALHIIGVFRTGNDQTTGRRYAVLLLENQGTTEITNIDFNDVRLFVNGTNYIVPVFMTLEPGASPAGSLTTLPPGYRLQVRWEFENAPSQGQLSVFGTSAQGSFNAGTRFLNFP